MERENIPIADGIPIGIENVFNAEAGIGGAYGSWGESFSNAKLPSFVEQRLGHSLGDDDILNLSELGFDSRQHVPDMSDAEHLELELEVGARLLKNAIPACGWKPSEIEGVLIGVSGPIVDDYVSQIAKRAGISDKRFKGECS